MEGPPTKITKYEMESQYLEGEVLEEEGQEEWLSEGILTDEDYTATAEQDSSQDATMSSLDQSTDHLINNSNSQDFSQTFTEPQYHINLNGEEYSHLADVGQEFDQSGQSFNQTDQEFDQSAQEFDQTGQEFDQTSQEFDQTGQEFDQTGQEFNQTGQQFSQESHQLVVKQSDQNFEQSRQNVANAGNIEQTPNNFESSSSHNHVDLPDDLDAFLIRKTCLKKPQDEVQEVDKDSDIDHSTKHSDDGNDTDELLRMLGDNAGKSNKTESKTTQKELDGDTTDCEDDYIFEGRNSQALKAAVAVTKVLKKTPPKAVPEDDTTDYCSDEAETIKTMFATRAMAKNKTNKTATKQIPTQNVVKKVVRLVNRQSPQATPKHQRLLRKYPTRNQQSILKTSIITNNTLNTIKHNNQITIKKTEKRNDETIRNAEKQNAVIKKVEKQNAVIKTVEKQNVVIKNAEKQNAVIKKVEKQNDVIKNAEKQNAIIKKVEKQNAEIKKFEKQNAVIKNAEKQNAVIKKAEKQYDEIKKTEKANDEIKNSVKQIVDKRNDDQARKTRSWSAIQMNKIGNPNEESIIKRKEPHDEESHEPEFLDEDEFDLDEESQRHPNKQTQKIMRPEQMDEDVPTDFDTDTEDDSVYDELPSSDSESQDDWFTLDIRAERAGDYIPLMGDQAYSLLSAEKAAVTGAINSLCQSMAALTEQASQQSAELRRATSSLEVVQNALKHL